MARDLTWVGSSGTNATTTAGAYSAADNWLPVNITNSTYRWTASGSGTSEYYLELAGGGNPGLVEPTNVQENIAAVRTNMAAGTAGSLTASQWDWADNDTLGFSTIYVRTSGSVDPDTLDDGTITYTDIPKATDHVRIPATSTQAISSGLDQSAVAIGDFIVEAGYTKAIGTSSTSLIIDPDAFIFSGTGTSYIDITTAAIAIEITTTATATTGKRGLYLRGTGITTMSVIGGSVGLAVQHNEASTVTTARVAGGSLWLGEGVTCTTMEQTGGDNVQRCATTNTKVYGGTLTTEEQGTITTMTVEGGIVYPNSTGTITTLTHNAGTVDFTTSGNARTVTTYAASVNGVGVLRVNPNAVTFTNRTLPSSPYQAQFTRV